ncbi:transposase [Cerasicoccus maritimus]|uniref:transposase n=1 Tax=Cerasicoccus maritimus TaxID=490089 RepID=UPI003CCE458B
MKKGHRSTEQIIRILRTSEGMKVGEACREHGMSTETYYCWKIEGVERGIRT